MEPAWDGQIEWRIKRSLRGRWPGLANDLVLATVLTAVGSAWVVGMVLVIWFSPDESLTDLIAVLIAGVCAAVLTGFGVAETRSAWRPLRRREDRIRFDGTSLWWMRHRPAAHAAEPRRVDRVQIARVRLGDGDGSVVLSMVDGTDHVLTDLGTPAERTALATAIGDRLAPGTAGVQPVLPPALPSGWRSYPSDGTWLLWRRTTAWRTWGLGVLTYVLTPVALLPAARTSGPLAHAMAWLGASAVGALIVRVGYEANRRRPGWLLSTGRLDATQVRARTGRHGRTVGRVVALDLTIAPAPGRKPYRLTAVLDRERRHEVIAGRDRHHVEGLATWLADRADLPLTFSGGAGSRELRAGSWARIRRRRRATLHEVVS